MGRLRNIKGVSHCLHRAALLSSERRSRAVWALFYSSSCARKTSQAACLSCSPRTARARSQQAMPFGMLGTKIKACVSSLAELYQTLVCLRVTWGAQKIYRPPVPPSGDPIGLRWGGNPGICAAFCDSQVGSLKASFGKKHWHSPGRGTRRPECQIR